MTRDLKSPPLSVCTERGQTHQTEHPDEIEGVRLQGPQYCVNNSGVDDQILRSSFSDSFKNK